MLLKTLIFNVLLLAVYLPGWGQTPVSKSLPPAQFSETMRKTPIKTVLDVRTGQEVATGVLPGAIVIDYFSSDFSQQLSKLDKTKPVFLYCAVGGRSGKAMQQMQQAGFKTVYNLAGGMEAWRKAGYPVAKKTP
jgi:phage shock protein E